jgi:hypothetical protein
LVEFESATRRSGGPFADKNRARSGSLLQTGGDVDSVATNEGASCTSPPDDYVARVHADSQCDLPLEQFS